MKKCIFALMISVLSIASVLAADHNLKGTYNWKVSTTSTSKSFVVPQIKSGFFVVTIYNQGPDVIDVGEGSHSRVFRDCDYVVSGSACSVTFYPTATPAKPTIYQEINQRNYSTGTIDITYYP